MSGASQYRLETLFEMRQRAKKEAEEIYAKKEQEAQKEQKKLQDMQQQLAQMQLDRERKRLEYAHANDQGQVTIEKIQIQARHIEMLKDKEAAFSLEIATQEKVRDEAKAIAEKFLQEMLEKTKEFKALEKHKEKWLLEVKKAREKKEEAAADDISQAQYFLRNEGDSGK